MQGQKPQLVRLCKSSTVVYILLWEQASPQVIVLSKGMRVTSSSCGKLPWCNSSCLKGDNISNSCPKPKGICKSTLCTLEKPATWLPVRYYNAVYQMKMQKSIKGHVYNNYAFKIIIIVTILPLSGWQEIVI